jgi:predicted Rossmann fold flavoprotein
MKVAVIGGGAAGLMAAITAARGGHAVTVFERQARVGKKLLTTGNGRCNLTNVAAAPDRYNGGAGEFTRYALDAFGVEDTLAFFRDLGLVTVTEESGRVYPLSDQAGSVVDVLRLSAAGSGAGRCCSSEVSRRKKDRRGFTVTATGSSREIYAV